MKTNKKVARIMAIVMISTLLLSNVAMAEGGVSKEETVYVNLNNKGEDIDKISSIWIHSDTPLNTIEDRSILKDVVNVKGNEIPTVEDDKLIWNTDEQDIYYQGKVDKELPIKPEIKYYLDGKEVEIEDIVGESGKLKIVIEVKNGDKRSIDLKDSGSKTVYAPYMVATLVDLPVDKFTNVKINTGKILSDGSNQVATFVSLPKFGESLGIGDDIIDLPDTLEIVADVVDFEMKPIVFTVTSEIPEIDGLEDVKDLDQLIEGIGKIKDASEKLMEATDKLYEGQIKLDGGIGELVGGIGQFKSGAGLLSDGSSKLKEGIGAAREGSIKIDEGSRILSQSGENLGKGFVELGEGAVQFGDKAGKFSQGAKQLADGVERIPEGTKALNNGMEEIINGTETIKNGQDGLTQGLGKSIEAIENIKVGKEKEGQAVGLALTALDGLDKIALGIEKLPGGEELAGPMKNILAQQRTVLEGLNSSNDELLLALNQVEEGLKEAQGASVELAEGMDNINNGQKGIGNGLNELTAGAEELVDASNRLTEGSIGLQKGADSLSRNASIARDGAGKFTEGSKGLSKGAKDLSSGLGELNKGADELHGGISDLSKGANQLDQGGKEIKKGSNQLVEGTGELNKGMNQFHQEGIKKISDELKVSDIDIASILKTKDELVNISKDNNSFTGINENMEGSLKFIMKTEGIKGEEEIEKLDIKEEGDQNKGFINWIKEKFNK